MGAQRTSNKDIAEKLDTLISILTAQAQAQTPAVVTEPEPVKEAPKAESNGHSVPATYMARMESKVQDAVNQDGEARVIYLRRNLKGETKIAYCLKARWPNLRDNGLIGAVKVIG
jgi:hypothetical protein